MRRASKSIKRSNHLLLFWVLAFTAIIYLAISGEWEISKATRTKPFIESSAAILLDLESGAVLYDKNSEAPMQPASMSKMMTELIVLEQVNEGAAAWSDRVSVSRYAAEVLGSQIGFNEGERFTVRELFEAMTVSSANDAAVALAEYIGGSETGFVELMNKRARELGFSESSVFGNATGLTVNDLHLHKEAAASQETLMTAEDTGKLAAYLLKKFPEVLEVSNRGNVKLASNGQTLAATNQMLPGKAFSYSGNDGLKTGYTAQAGYCFTGTAKRDGRRLISVVMGASTAEERFVETELLLDYGFQS